MLSLEFVITCDWRSSDLLTALIYWRSSMNSTSVLIATSHTSIYVNDWKRRRTIRTHSLLSIRIQHWTTAIAHLYWQLIQRLRDTRQEQNRIIWYNHTLSSHRTRLSFTTYFLAQWMTIIKQGTQFQHYNHEHHECKESWSSWSKIKTSLYRISSIWKAEQEWWIAEKQRRHASRIYSSVTRWIEVIDSLLNTIVSESVESSKNQKKKIVSELLSQWCAVTM